MAYYRVEKGKITDLVKDLSRRFEIFAHVKKGDLLQFDKVVDTKDILIGVDKGGLSPKSSLLPQNEIMFSQKEGKIIKNEFLKKERLLFGVRPCDVKAIYLLDKVFNEGDFEDTFYKEKRESTVIFGIGCNRPLSSCFCTSFEIGPFEKDGCDVFIIDLGREYLLERITGRGEEILSSFNLEEAEDDKVGAISDMQKKAESKISNRPDIEGIGERLNDMFSDPIWNELHLKCLGCGVCTFFCPTCHCFDIVDEEEGFITKRLRIWDSCQFPLFTLHASGHQPRATGKERFRQRVMHKFSYFFDRFREVACVGCGRCILNCPVNLDIREVIKVLSKK